jgi:hypothetical protein
MTWRSSVVLAVFILSIMILHGAAAQSPEEITAVITSQSRGSSYLLVGHC